MLPWIYLFYYPGSNGKVLLEEKEKKGTQRIKPNDGFIRASFKRMPPSTGCTCGYSRIDMKIPDQPLHFQNKDEWRAWLQANHTAQNEAWLVILKNHGTSPGVYYEEAVEEAVCFGWIDGVMKSATAESYFLRFSPRKRGSIWSMSNQKRVEQLMAQGRMTEAGMAKVREAKENGEWEAAVRREDTSRLPEDLRKALEGNVEAQANFEKFPASQKKQFLYWITSAKTEKTRQKRIQGVVEMAVKNKQS